MKISLSVFIITVLVLLLAIGILVIIIIVDNTAIDKLKAEKNLIYQDRLKLEAELKENKKITEKKEKLLTEVKRIRTETKDETDDQVKAENYRRYIHVWNGLN